MSSMFDKYFCHRKNTAPSQLRGLSLILVPQFADGFPFGNSFKPYRQIFIYYSATPNAS